MKKNGLLWIAGLDTSIDAKSDLCGIRTTLEKTANLMNAELILATWNGDGMSYPVGETLKRINVEKYDFVAAGGHSHGAFELYDQLRKMGDASLYDTAAFADLCPPCQPGAWMGGPWPTPTNVNGAQCLFQRNDVPLAGVRMTGASANGKAVELIDVTGWGLHHAGDNGMLRDPRVQNKIELFMLEAFNNRLRMEMGFGGGGQTIPPTTSRLENA